MKDTLKSINIEIKAELKYKKDAKRLNPKFKSKCGEVRLKNLREMKKMIIEIMKTPDELSTPEIMSANMKRLYQLLLNFLEVVINKENTTNELA